jgi:hypothetical protein
MMFFRGKKQLILIKATTVDHAFDAANALYFDENGNRIPGVYDHTIRYVSSAWGGGTLEKQMEQGTLEEVAAELKEYRTMLFDSLGNDELEVLDACIARQSEGRLNGLTRLYNADDGTFKVPEDPDGYFSVLVEVTVNEFC